MMTKRDLLRSAALAAITATTAKSIPASAQTSVTPTEARAISKEAYIYGFPMVKNNYLYRMAGAVLGIGGNSKQEAMYPIYAIDAAGQKLDGANKYTLHFAAGQLPPVNAFWSLTMYELPQSLLVANPINRYLINSPMLPPQSVKNADGGLTLYVQNETPGKDKEPNWLPAPKGLFIAFMRLYWPKEAALDGAWKHPPITKT